MLKGYLDSPDLRLKLNALQSIGDIKTPEAEEILVEYLQKSPLEMALLSAGILADNGNDKAINLLKEGIESPVLLTNQKTMIAMSKVTNPKILPVVKIALNSDNDVVKAYALNMLTRINDSETIEVIKPLLNNVKIMPRAMIALSKNNSPEALKLFEDIFTEGNTEKRAYAIAVLTMVKNNNIIPVLKMALEDENETIRVAAAKILQTFKDDSGIETLKIATKSENNELSLSAAAFLGYKGNDSGAQILSDAVYNNDLPSWKRLDMSILLEKLGDKEVISELKSLMNQQRPNSLSYDIFPSEETLKSLLNDDSKWVQLNTSVFMTRLKNEDCLPTLEKLSQDSDLKVRTTSVELLGRLGSKKALPVLQKCLDDESVRVRVKSAQAILNILTNTEDKEEKGT